MDWGEHKQNQAFRCNMYAMLAQPFDAETSAARPHIRRAKRIAR
jgi:hypothetical protein